MKNGNIFLKIDLIILSIAFALQIGLVFGLIINMGFLILLMLVTLYLGFYQLFSSLMHVVTRTYHPSFAYYRRLHLFGSPAYLLLLVIGWGLYTVIDHSMVPQFLKQEYISTSIMVLFFIVFPNIIAIGYWYMSYRDYNLSLENPNPKS